MRINTQILEKFAIVQDRETSYGSTWLEIYWCDRVIAELQIKEKKIVHLEMTPPTLLNLSVMQELIIHEKEICEWVSEE